MNAPYLDAQAWIEDVTLQLAGVKLPELLQDGIYYLPWHSFGPSDLEDEVFGDHQPSAVPEAAFAEQMVPELQRVCNEANKKLGSFDFFSVDYTPGEQEATVDFTFTDEEIPELKRAKVLSDYATLASITGMGPLYRLLSSKKAFSDFTGPLFDGASVATKEKTNADGTTNPDPTSAKLLLPDIAPGDAERVPESFSITVSKEFEDNRAMVKAYSFTFQVSDVKFEPLGNGQVRPKFSAQLKEYKHV